MRQIDDIVLPLAQLPRYANGIENTKSHTSFVEGINAIDRGMGFEERAASGSSDNVDRSVFAGEGFQQRCRQNHVA